MGKRGKYIIEEWLHELPDPIKKRALYDFKKLYEEKAIPTHDDIYSMLRWAFPWEDSEEGYTFWENVHDYYAPPKSLPTFYIKRQEAH